MKDLKRFILESSEELDIEADSSEDKVFIRVSLSPTPYYEAHQNNRDDDDEDEDDWDDYDEDPVMTLVGAEFVTAADMDCMSDDVERSYCVWAKDLLEHKNTIIDVTTYGYGFHETDDDDVIEEVVKGSFENKCDEKDVVGKYLLFERCDNSMRLYVGIFDNEAKVKAYIKKELNGEENDFTYTYEKID